MVSCNLLDSIRGQLKESRGDWVDISQASGVPYFTISKIASGVTANPRWQTVTKLADYFGFDSLRVAANSDSESIKNNDAA